MARGDSGRVVIEVDPSLKHALYVALATSGSTLKDWFVKEATRHCAEVAQPTLFTVPPELKEDASAQAPLLMPEVKQTGKKRVPRSAREGRAG